MSAPSAELIELVGHVQLINISFLELSARRGQEEEPQQEVTPEYALGVERNDSDERRFRLRLRCSLEFGQGAEVVVEPVAEYAVGEGAVQPISHALVVEYANEVGIMAMIPYLRHAIADLTLRVMGSALTIPVIPRGAIAFDIDDSDAENGPRAERGVTV